VALQGGRQRVESLESERQRDVCLPIYSSHGRIADHFDGRYREYPGKPHWWPFVLNSEEVQAFIDAAVLSSMLDNRPRSSTFTLTVAIPAESGSLHGWQIESIKVPGR
jgi:hypothetical protein